MQKAATNVFEKKEEEEEEEKKTRAIKEFSIYWSKQQFCED